MTKRIKMIVGVGLLQSVLLLVASSWTALAVIENRSRIEQVSNELDRLVFVLTERADQRNAERDASLRAHDELLRACDRTPIIVK